MRGEEWPEAVEAQDPNTSPERLSWLACRGWGLAVSQNPALPLVLLEDPYWPQRLENYALQCMIEYLPWKASLLLRLEANRREEAR